MGAKKWVSLIQGSLDGPNFSFTLDFGSNMKLWSLVPCWNRCPSLEMPCPGNCWVGLQHPVVTWLLRCLDLTMARQSAHRALWLSPTLSGSTRATASPAAKVGTCEKLMSTASVNSAAFSGSSWGLRSRPRPRYEMSSNSPGHAQEEMFKLVKRAKIREFELEVFHNGFRTSDERRKHHFHLKYWYVGAKIKMVKGRVRPSSITTPCPLSERSGWRRMNSVMNFLATSGVSNVALGPNRANDRTSWVR